MTVPKLRVWHMILLVAASAAFLSVFEFRQAVYDPTAARLRQVRYADAAVKAAVIRELMADEVSGPNVAPTLLEALRDSDPTVRGLAAQGLAQEVLRGTTVKKPHEDVSAVKAALTEALRDRDPSVRVQAASGLSLLDVKSEESFAILLRTARTPAAAPKAIGGIDDRFRALGDLAYSYFDKPETVPTILAAMANQDARVRGQGVIALNLHLRRPVAITEPMIAALLVRLDDEDDSVRGSAGLVLSRFGQRTASRAVPLLVRNLTLPRSIHHREISEALRRFGLDAAEARVTLRLLGNGNGNGDAAVRKAAQEALVAIEKACRTFDEETLPQLVAELRHAEPSVRVAAAQELARHGARAKAAVPALIKAVDDPDPKVRGAASGALEAIRRPNGFPGQNTK
jgi:HEAT repeat protein